MWIPIRESHLRISVLGYGVFIYLIFMDIKIMCWNCQGAGHPRFHKIIRKYRHEISPNVLCLLEPRISGIRADGIIAKLGFFTLFQG